MKNKRVWTICINTIDICKGRFQTCPFQLYIIHNFAFRIYNSDFIPIFAKIYYNIINSYGKRY